MTDIAGVARPSPLRSAQRLLARLTPGQRPRAADPAAVSRQLTRQLARLGSGWHVLDDVPAGESGSIAHLVVGPGGVFAVTARYDAHSTICLGADSLLVGDRRVNHGHASRHDAADVSDRLSDAVGCPVAVTALVVIVGDRRFVTPDQPDDAAVRVVTPAGGVRWLRRQPIAWTAFGVERILAAAVEPATWGLHPSTRPTGADVDS